MMDDIERVARVMGMKPHREVLEVREVDGGHSVRTHDGQWTLVRDSGVVEPVDEASAAMLRGFHGQPDPVELASGGIVKNPGVVLVGEQGPEDSVVRGTAKPAPKRRGRS